MKCYFLAYYGSSGLAAFEIQVYCSVCESQMLSCHVIPRMQQADRQLFALFFAVTFQLNVVGLRWFCESFDREYNSTVQR